MEDERRKRVIQDGAEYYCTDDCLSVVVKFVCMFLSGYNYL